MTPRRQANTPAARSTRTAARAAAQAATGCGCADHDLFECEWENGPWNGKLVCKWRDLTDAEKATAATVAATDGDEGK